MCLQKILSDNKMESFLRDQPDVIKVYKYCRVGHHYGPLVIRPFERTSLYKYGLGHADTRTRIEYDNFKYWSGFHFFLQPDRKFFSKKWDGYYVEIECLVLKDWITAVGYEDWCGMQLVIVANKAIFPYQPETKARLSDLEQHLKETKYENNSSKRLETIRQDNCSKVH